MKIRHIFSFFSLVLILLSGCRTTSGLAPVHSLRELEGHWICDKDGSEIEFPSSLEKKFFVYSGPLEDSTEKWSALAKKHGLTVSQLWDRRWCYADGFPQGDENSTQHGIKTTQVDFQKFISRECYLIPQKVLLGNCDAFSVFSKSGQQYLVQTGDINLYSDKFASIPANGRVYRKVK